MGKKIHNKIVDLENKMNGLEEKIEIILKKLTE
jgi:hypothetical protein